MAAMPTQTLTNQPKPLQLQTSPQNTRSNEQFSAFTLDNRTCHRKTQAIWPQRRPTPNLQQKRTLFHNQIRQQQRQSIKRNMRLQLLEQRLEENYWDNFLQMAMKEELAEEMRWRQIGQQREQEDKIFWDSFRWEGDDQQKNCSVQNENSGFQNNTEENKLNFKQQMQIQHGNFIRPYHYHLNEEFQI